MEVFRNAKTVRLKSHHDKFLVADEDEGHVSQDRSGASRSARWSVELSGASDAVIRLKSCHGRYLTASNEPMLLGMTGRKVLQTLPPRLDSSVEWEPVRDGFQVRLKTRYGQYLRANGGPPPWRNSVTHDIPHRTSTQDWVLWDVEIVEVRTKEGEFVKEQKTAPAAVAEAEGRWELSSPESTPSRSPRVSRADVGSVYSYS